MIDDRDDIAAALGRLVARWGILEGELISLLEILLGVDQFRAAMVFNAFPALGQKLQLLERLTHTFVDDEAANHKIVDFLHRANSLMAERNQYVHAVWGYDDPPALILFPSIAPNNKTKRLRESQRITAEDDLQSAADKVAALAGEIQEFVRRDCAALQVRHRPSP
jgi:hypothetical protein